jgi:putative ABC transport system substrate-binding protein
MGKRSRIGIITFGFEPSSRPVEAFRQALCDHGHVEGKNIAFEYRFAKGQIDTLPTLAAELVGLNVDVIVTEGTPTAVAVKRATTSIPIVTAAVTDPVRLGLITSFARPGGNVTGVTFAVGDRAGKQLQLLKEIAPNAKLVAVIHNAARTDMAERLAEAKAAAQSLGFSLQLTAVRSPADLDAALDSVMSARADAFTTLGDGMLWGNRKRIVDFAAKIRLPAVFPEREFAESGGLLAYGPDLASNFRRAAAYVDRILKGVKPADLPVEQPTKLELVVNLKTAAALGIKIPPAVMVRADEVLQ